jgi:hypothetical protein
LVNKFPVLGLESHLLHSTHQTDWLHQNKYPL